MTSTPWIPKSYRALREQCFQARMYLDGKLGDFGIEGVSAEWINNKFNPALDIYNIAFYDWLDKAERTALKIITLKAARKALLPLYRELYAFLKSNPLVTDIDLQTMGFPKQRKGKYTRVAPPKTVPEATVTLPHEAVVKISFRDRGAKKRGKPAGVHGAEILWSVADVPARHWHELTKSAFDTASPHTFAFSSQERGKILSFALRWQNTRGEKGDWSSIYTAIIP
jgi:hypothetical protein